MTMANQEMSALLILALEIHLGCYVCCFFKRGLCNSFILDEFGVHVKVRRLQ